jgi:hypothetical protein
MHAKEEQVHGMLIGCAEWFFNAAELCKISVEVWMSAMGSFSTDPASLACRSMSASPRKRT